MKRRSFLATLAGIFAAPFVVKKAVAAIPAIKPYTVAVDWVLDPVEMCKREGIHRQMTDEEKQWLQNEAERQWDETGKRLRNESIFQEGKIDVAAGFADFAYAQARDDIFGTRPWLK